MIDPTKVGALDLETDLIEPGILAPRIVCASIFWGEAHLKVGTQVVPAVRQLLRESGLVIAGANIAFDFGCLSAECPDLLPDIFAAYADGRIHDVQIAQALHAIAEGNLYLDPRTGRELMTVDPVTGKRKRGRYSLERCVDLVLGRGDAKRADRWRMSYALLRKIPVESWPPDAQEYPLDDVRNPREVALAQLNGGGAGCTPGPHRNLEDLAAQCETAFCLHLGAMWGIRTDRERVEALRRRTEEAHGKFLEKFRALGFLDVDGDKDARAVKRAVILAYGVGGPCPAGCAAGRTVSPKSGNPVWCPECSGTGLNPGAAPRTPAGGVCADRDALMESGDPDLVSLGDNEPEKIRDTYLPFLETGLDRPITLRPNILVSSGRTSYDGLIQLLPRDAGVRECIAARPGRVWCDVDFSAFELCTLAQFKILLFGSSSMADVINATGDPGSLHAALAAEMVGVPFEEMLEKIASKDPQAKKIRQASKLGNFGFPGGMGAPKFVFSQRRKSAGETKCPDGLIYPGNRFCVLLRGAERCGLEKVTEWKGRECPAALCRACVEVVEYELRPAWFRRWWDMPRYFEWVKRRVDIFDGEFPCLPTRRVRGGCGFTDGANGGFQALASDAAKLALRRLTRECYLDRSSVLYAAKTRPVFFTHDSVTAEMDEDLAHLAGPRMAEVMVRAAAEIVTDVALKAEPALMRFLSKAAGDPVLKDGKLIPWEDQ
jgi:hypothetical protein